MGALAHQPRSAAGDRANAIALTVSAVARRKRDVVVPGKRLRQLERANFGPGEARAERTRERHQDAAYLWPAHAVPAALDRWSGELLFMWRHNRTFITEKKRVAGAASCGATGRQEPCGPMISRNPGHSPPTL